jgi:hypothetical protein
MLWDGSCTFTSTWLFEHSDKEFDLAGLTVLPVELWFEPQDVRRQPIPVPFEAVTSEDLNLPRRSTDASCPGISRLSGCQWLKCPNVPGSSCLCCFLCGKEFGLTSRDQEALPMMEGKSWSEPLEERKGTAEEFVSVAISIDPG